MYTCVGVRGVRVHLPSVICPCSVGRKGGVWGCNGLEIAVHVGRAVVEGETVVLVDASDSTLRVQDK